MQQRYKIERVVSKWGSNPVEVFLMVLLSNPQRRVQIETTPVQFQDKIYAGQPDKILERIKKMIEIRRLGTGFEYRFYNHQLACDIRVIADSRRDEDWSVNNYK